MKLKKFVVLLALLSVLLTGLMPVLAQDDALVFDLTARLDAYLSNELPPAWGNVSVDDLNIELLENPPFLIDVRTPEEWDADGFIEGATFISVKTIAQYVDMLPTDLDTPIVVYCKAGTRGQFAMITLQVMGYTNVRNMAGGILAWKEAGYPVGDTPFADMTFDAPGGPEVDGALLDAMDSFLVDNIPAGWGQVSVDDYAVQSMETEYFLLDVRTPGEWENDGILEGATLVTINDLAKNLDQIPFDMPIMVYCKAGTRGNFGAIMLQMLGYEAYNMKGGILAWVDAGYEVVTPEFDLSLRLNQYLTKELPPAWGNVSVEDLNLELLENPPFLIDVRTEEEWDADGYIEGATFVSVKSIAQNLDMLPADLDAPIVVYCKAGTRGQFAMITLQVLGYTNVRNMAGGILAWKEAGYPVGETPFADMEFEAPGGAEFDADVVAAMDVFLTENIPAGWGQVSVEDYSLQSMETEYFLLDVRTQGEWDNDGYIEGATLVTINKLAQHLDAIPMDMPIMVYCKAGTRGNFGAIILQMLGYEAYNMKGGILAWIDAGYDVVMD